MKSFSFDLFERYSRYELKAANSSESLCTQLIRFIHERAWKHGTDVIKYSSLNRVLLVGGGKGRGRGAGD